jgi:hypothetical protein
MLQLLLVLVLPGEEAVHKGRQYSHQQQEEQQEEEGLGGYHEGC